jgi:hypothetical protein
MKVHNLKKARQQRNVKVAIDNIQDILKVFDLTNKALENFKGYKSVQNVIALIKSERGILDSHLQKFKKLKDKSDE